MVPLWFVLVLLVPCAFVTYTITECLEAIVRWYHENTY
jgi:hypothetical protein